MDGRLLEKDVIVFDVGDVLVGFDPDQITEGFGLSAALSDAVFRSGLWGWHDSGLMTTGELARLMCRCAGTDREEDFLTVCEVLDAHHRFQKALDASLWLPGLKERGKKLYYLTNYGSPVFERTKAKFPFFSLFDGGVVSSHEHMVKPMPVIYRLLCARYGFAPQDALYIDDNERNILAARQLGFSVWQYRGQELPG